MRGIQGQNVLKKLVVVTAVFLALAGCGTPTQTPEQAFISALRKAEPNSETTSDAKLLAMGRVVCKVFTEQGAEGVRTALEGVLAQNGAETRRIMGAVSIAATTHLCPVKNT